MLFRSQKQLYLYGLCWILLGCALGTQSRGYAATRPIRIVKPRDEAVDLDRGQHSVTVCSNYDIIIPKPKPVNATRAVKGLKVLLARILAARTPETRPAVDSLSRTVLMLGNQSGHAPRRRPAKGDCWLGRIDHGFSLCYVFLVGITIQPLIRSPPLPESRLVIVPYS